MKLDMYFEKECKKQNKNGEGRGRHLGKGEN